jgi:hypothetical protein
MENATRGSIGNYSAAGDAPGNYSALHKMHCHYDVIKTKIAI